MSRPTIPVDTHWLKNALERYRNRAFQDCNNWITCNHLFGCGRTKSIELCNALGIDPDGYDTASQGEENH